MSSETISRPSIAFNTPPYPSGAFRQICLNRSRYSQRFAAVPPTLHSHDQRARRSYQLLPKSRPPRFPSHARRSGWRAHLPSLSSANSKTLHLGLSLWRRRPRSAVGIWIGIRRACPPRLGIGTLPTPPQPYSRLPGCKRQEFMFGAGTWGIF